MSMFDQVPDPEADRRYDRGGRAGYQGYRSVMRRGSPHRLPLIVTAMVAGEAIGWLRVLPTGVARWFDLAKLAALAAVAGALWWLTRSAALSGAQARGLTLLAAAASALVAAAVVATIATSPTRWTLLVGTAVIVSWNASVIAVLLILTKRLSPRGSAA
jgi:hypothetical protein